MEKDLKKMGGMQKSSPEYSYYHKVKAFFAEDPDIEVDEAYDYEFTIYVHDKRKYEILNKALCIPSNLDRLTVNIEYVGEVDEKVSGKDMAYLLSGNKYFSRYIDADENGLIPGKLTYLCMKPEVVQYYDDIFNNPMGYDTKTAEALARELFYGNRLNITTDIKED